MAGIGDFIKSAFSGAGNGLLTGVSKIISDFKIDPAVAAQMNEQMKELVAKHESDMANIAEQQYEAQLKDVQNARDREVAIANSDKAPLLTKLTLPILAIAVTLGFFGLLAYMLKYDVPQSNKSLLDIMLGSLGTAWISIVGYYFGSSKGSDDKNKIIDNLSK